MPGSVFLKKPYRPSKIVATIRTLIAPDERPTGAALRPLFVVKNIVRHGEEGASGSREIGFSIASDCAIGC